MPSIILGVSSSFCANFLVGQVGFLVNNGWKVIIISGPGEEITSLSQNEKAKLYEVSFNKSIWPFADILLLIRIIRIILREKPALVNAGNPKSGFLIMVACWLLKFRNRIFTLHGMVSDSKQGMTRFLIRLSEKACCSIARKVIVVSPSLRQHAIRENVLAPVKGIVIRNGSCNGVDLELFQKSARVRAQAQPLREQVKPAEEFVIGFVGRLSTDKGVDVLFEAFNILAQQYGHIRLLIAGPIEKENPFSRAYYHQLHHDKKITYLGKVSYVPPVYAVMDILVLSSFREGFGNVLIEAAAMEVPVIAPDIPGCQNALQAGYNGLLFRKGDVKNLVATIQQYLHDPELRRLHGENGRRFVQENFRQEDIWKGQLNLYNNMIHEQ